MTAAIGSALPSYQCPTMVAVMPAMANCSVPSRPEAAPATVGGRDELMPIMAHSGLAAPLVQLPVPGRPMNGLQGQD
ncbi:MAG: hypothetical protein ACRESV_04545, partial [Nevskiales bacterium]